MTETVADQKEGGLTRSQSQNGRHGFPALGKENDLRQPAKRCRQVPSIK